MTPVSDSEFREVVALLQSLIQIDTTNPPGNERPAADLIAALLRDDGLSPELVGASADRPNLVCRLSADPAHRCERPLILSCHLDVVPASDPENWTHPPFAGVEADGCVWGRGAIDMKGFAVMALTIFRRLAESNGPRNRDLIFVAAADEEAGTELGSRWLVENRPDLLGDSPEYVINEVGGFTIHRAGQRFYPIQVAEKGVAWLKMTARGDAGHASLPSPDSAVARLAAATDKIARTPLPWHVSPEARRFLGEMATGQGSLAKLTLPLLLNSVLGPKLLPFAISDLALRGPVEAILRNTATPTVVRAGEKTNVLPSEASCEIDGRLAPGQTAEYLIRELRHVVADDSISFEVLKTAPAVSFDTETPLFETICQSLRQHDPEGIPVASIIPGFTDSQNYARIGATCYGFYPLQLPPEIEFSKLFHGVDERIPLEGMRWGLQVLEETIKKTVAV